jgi:hypothetical protein
LRNFGMRWAVAAGVVALVVCGGWMGLGKARAQSATVQTVPASEQSAAATATSEGTAAEAQWKLLGMATRRNSEWGSGIQAVAVDESDASGRTIYVTNGEEIRKSSDLGATWDTVSGHAFVGTEGALASSLSVSPAATHHLMLAAASHSTDSVWRSTDGGQSFRPISLGAIDVGSRVISVQFDPTDASGMRAYAFVRRGYDVAYNSAISSAVFGSEDGGKTWTLRAEQAGAYGLPLYAGLGVPVGPGAESIVWGVMDHAPGGEGFRVWEMHGPLTKQEAFSRVFVVTKPQAMSTDGYLDPSHVHAMMADPGVPDVLYAAVEDRVLVSVDKGNTWKAEGEGLGGSTVTALAVDEGTRTLFAATEAGTVWSLALGAAEAGGAKGTPEPAANNPRPKITSISPDNTQVGSTGLVLTVTGSNFLASSVINFGQTTLSPSTENSTTLTATVPNSAYAQAGVVAVTVSNPGPGGGISNGQQFKIQDFTFGKITPTTQSVIAGATATYTVQMAGLEGYNTEVTLSCADGTPPAATCYFDPTELIPSGIEKVSIATVSNTTSRLIGGRRGRWDPWVPAGLLKVYAISAVVFVGGWFLMVALRRRSLVGAWRGGALVAGLFVLGGLALGAAGCGGTSSTNTTTPGEGTTPGTYTITLSATGTNDATHNANIVLTVTNPQ